MTKPHLKEDYDIVTYCISMITKVITFDQYIINVNNLKYIS